MSAFPPPMAAPAPVWQEATAADGKKYYFNPLTNKTQWDKPDELKTDVERAMELTGWALVHTPEGKPYYYHKETMKTTWTLPDAVQKAVDEARAKLQVQAPPPGPSHWVAGPSSFDNRRSDRDDYYSERRDRDRELRDRDRDFANIAFTSSSELQFSSAEEAEAAFMKLLKQLKVQADWDWRQTVRAGVRDPNWRAIADPEKREELFKKYCEDLRAQEKNKEQERQVKLRNDFTAMLRSHPEIKYYSRWKTVLPIIEEETIFRSAKDDSERRALFEDYIVTLRKENEVKEEENRRSAMDDVMDLLQGLDLEPFTLWTTAEEKLENKEEFKDEKFQTLTKLDVLTQFQKHIRLLQREHNDRVQAERKNKYRIERKNREAFMTLLKELRDKGQLRYGTRWTEIHPIIENDPRYLAMLGQAGSSPLHFFWDALNDEEAKFRTLRRHALDVLEYEQYEVTLSTSFDEFLDLMKKNERTADIDNKTLQSIFDYVVAKVKKREEESRRDEEHSERVAMDNLRSAIKRLDPPVALSDTWDVVRSRVERSDEYRALKSDSLRESVFDKYMRRLKDKESDRRDRGRRDDRDRDRRDRDRDYRNGHGDSHRRHRTRTRSPEHDPYAAERRRAQQDREARYKNNDNTGLSPPPRRERRDDDRYDRPRRSPGGDHYGRERREREVERERSYVSRADPRESSVSLLDYGDGAGRTASSRRRRESDESASKRDSKRPRHEEKPKNPAPEPAKEEDRALRSGSEEGEIEED